MTHGRIIYVTGMKPKPPPDIHKQALTKVLATGLSRADSKAAEWLGSRPQNFTLISWTSLLYEDQRDIGLDMPGIERLIDQPESSAADRREINAPMRRLARLWHLFGDSFPWLTDIIARRDLKVTLAEVRRYIENRGGISRRIRAQLRAPLEQAWQSNERVLLIGHSLGSVIAYDTLWELSRSGTGGRVDLFLTLGSPLATRFIRKGVKGAGVRGRGRYPNDIGRWVNVTARGERVALHPALKPFFGDIVRYGLAGSLEDHAIYNHFRGATGLDVHKSYGYLIHALVAGLIVEWLGAS